MDRSNLSCLHKPVEENFNVLYPQVIRIVFLIATMQPDMVKLKGILEADIAENVHVR